MLSNPARTPPEISCCDQPSRPLVDSGFRPETDADLPFLEALYGSTRAEELALVPWDDAQKRAFVTMQFTAQRTYYRAHYPDAAFDVITDAVGQPIGRRYVLRRPDGLNLIDMALLPAWQGQGRGTALLWDLAVEADRDRLPIVLHVELGNPAGRLYERFGFTDIGSNGIYRKMRRLPTPPPGSDP